MVQAQKVIRLARNLSTTIILITAVTGFGFALTLRPLARNSRSTARRFQPAISSRSSDQISNSKRAARLASLIQGRDCDNCPGVNAGVLEFRRVAPSDADKNLPPSERGSLAWHDLTMSYQMALQIDSNTKPHNRVSPEYIPSGYAAQQRGEVDVNPLDVHFGRGDYDIVIGGYVTGDEGNYSLELRVNDGYTFDRIATANVAFTSAGDWDAIAQRAVAQLSPLRQKVCDYWAKKRDGDMSLALNPLTIQVTPRKSQVEVGESTPVDIELLDCDSQPLKNRKVSLSTDLGSISPSTIKTDEEGKATATFTAENKAGAATLYARYDYTVLTNRKQDYDEGWGTVVISDPFSGAWEMTVDVTDTTTSTQEKSERSGQSTEVRRDTTTLVRTAHVTAFFDTKYDPSKPQAASLVVKPASITGGGNFNYSSNNYLYQGSPGCSLVVRSLHHATGSQLDKEQVSMLFTFNKEKASANGSITIKGKGSGTQTRFESCNEKPGSSSSSDPEDENYSIEFGEGDDTVEAPINLRDQLGPGFRISLSKNETQKNPDTGTIETHTRTGYVTIRRLRKSETPSEMRRPARRP